MRIEHNLVCTAHNLREMWGKLGGSVAALSNIKGLVANFAFRVSSIYVFIRISSRRVMNFRFLLIY